jgi:hypothetical protein
MALTIRRLVPRDGARDIGRALEATVREALQGLEDEDLAVSFGIWDDGDSVQFVCRVETPPGDPLSSEPPWRWWSPLFRTPEELRAELATLVGRRRDNQPSAASDETTDEVSSAAS